MWYRSWGQVSRAIYRVRLHDTQVAYTELIQIGEGIRYLETRDNSIYTFDVRKADSFADGLGEGVFRRSQP